MNYKELIQKGKEDWERRKALHKDASDDEGKWITTENGHKLHLNAKGEIDKGNPHVVDAIKKKSESSKESKSTNSASSGNKPWSFEKIKNEGCKKAIEAAKKGSVEGAKQMARDVISHIGDPSNTDDDKAVEISIEGGIGIGFKRKGEGWIPTKGKEKLSSTYTEQKKPLTDLQVSNAIINAVTKKATEAYKDASTGGKNEGVFSSPEEAYNEEIKYYLSDRRFSITDPAKHHK